MRTTTKQYNLEFCVALGFMVTGRFTAVEVREVLFAHFKREALFRHLLCGEVGHHRTCSQVSASLTRLARASKTPSPSKRTLVLQTEWFDQRPTKPTRSTSLALLFNRPNGH